MNTYRFSFDCTCPADNKPDTYQVTIKTHGIIPCEELKDFIFMPKEEHRYQEAWASYLADKWRGCYVRIEGHHLGVEVIAEAGCLSIAG